MKVIFKHSKSLGNSKVGSEVEMFSTTAAVLQRKGYGKITKKVVSVKETANGIKKGFADLTKDDISDLELDNSLVEE